MVQTQWWQEEQLKDIHDSKPWLAYTRTLRKLDARLPASVRQWMQECLNQPELQQWCPKLFSIFTNINAAWCGFNPDALLNDWQQHYMRAKPFLQWANMDASGSNASERLQVQRSVSGRGSRTASGSVALQPAHQQDQAYDQPTNISWPTQLPEHGVHDNIAVTNRLCSMVVGQLQDANMINASSHEQSYSFGVQPSWSQQHVLLPQREQQPDPAFVLDDLRQEHAGFSSAEL